MSLPTTPKLQKRLDAANKERSSRRTDSNDVFEWVVDPATTNTAAQATESIGTPSRRVTRSSNLSNRIFYKSFRKNGETFTLGDCVLVQNDSEKPWIAIIKRMWQDEHEKRMFSYRWFNRPEDVFPKMRRRPKKDGQGSVEYDEQELFYSNLDGGKLLQNIESHCEVLSYQCFKSKYPDGMVPSAHRERNFFCRRAYDAHNRFIDLDWDDFYSNRRFDDPKTDCMFEETNRKKDGNGRKFVRVEESDESDNDKDGNFFPEVEKVEEEDGDAGEEEEEEEEEDEEDEAEKRKKKNNRTPTKRKRRTVGSSKSTPRKTPKRSPSKLTPRSQRTKPILAVTPLRQRPQIVTTPSTPYERARERLHVSAVPHSLPCREEEFAEILGYLEGAIEEGTGTYISGVPGTGKTATVHEVIRHLLSKAENGNVPPFQFVEINGMKLTEPSHAYTLLWEALAEKRMTANHALELLEKQFSTPSPRRYPCVVLMDELDLLVTKRQTVMYNFFEWPNRPHSKLIVIAVANTMDLPERMLTNKVSSRLGLTRINFQPYTHHQLIKIIESRLEGIDAFEKDAVQFAARKVSAVSGDARRALDICRRAVEIVETKLKKDKDNPTPTDIPTPTTAYHVTIPTINEAVREMFSSANVSFIRHASLHQKIFLLATMQRLRRSGVADVEFAEVAQQHVQTCRWHNVEPPSSSDLAAICASLGQARCLLVEPGRLDLHQRIRLNVSEEDVTMALKSDTFFRKLV
ncbi:P-loop containing nucleoside triphosphate hydrolase protein [Jimgerdemannia flammicorona]|uniref:Origin recognition complex subunit 1 n=2 Tax=Jimgerdemannia flammicorona TaxID=994334 RepID=A0A433D3J9_9FUNG|nr:P-loop containing nucleoside triphosphate hydrolase protein [Jimgerdemannia flammicorona]RUS33830.1 P-loop containing nucleoside triphosphate hydrolase protein [Jimgerdemannia flammicorona]